MNIIKGFEAVLSVFVVLAACIAVVAALVLAGIAAINLVVPSPPETSVVGVALSIAIPSFLIGAFS